MKAGIDSYSYHRFFGEVYPEQVAPPKPMSVEGFLKRAHELGADGVSLESCFLPSFDEGFLRDLRAHLDEYHLDRVFAWGHPRGLEAGKSEKAFQEMLAAFRYAQIVGAPVMRVVSSNRAFRGEPHQPQIERLKELYRRAVKVAAEYDIKIAVENHLDYNSAELLEILESVNSSYLGINFDSGNFLRLHEDPAVAMQKLASSVFATHLKDLRVTPGIAPDQWNYYTTVAIGDGIVDNGRLVQMLNNVGYQGLLAVEIDFLHPDYNNDEDAAVARSVKAIKRMIDALKN
jgi:3-oxoisoapionate decarboxylase